GFPYYAQFEDGPVAVGWLRASHREPDPELSTEFLTVLAHRRALPVPRGQVIEAEIEILPSGTRFEAGEGLLLIVQGTDIKRYPKPLTYARHEDTVNAGPHRIHTGPGHPSRIILPILPASDARG
ncbi:MAG: CocE/NonD family hydrolase C-terminal non-catalytic domain-containing protein, partial [Trebonia sp.]